MLHANGAWVYLEKTVNLDGERIKPKRGKKGMTRRTIWSVVDGDIQDPQIILINVSLLYALGLYCGLWTRSCKVLLVQQKDGASHQHCLALTVLLTLFNKAATKRACRYPSYELCMLSHRQTAVSAGCACMTVFYWRSLLALVGRTLLTQEQLRMHWSWRWKLDGNGSGSSYKQMNSANAIGLRESAIDVLGEVNNEDNQLRILQVLNGGYNDKSLSRPSNRVCLPIGKVCVEKKRNLTKVNSQPRTCLAFAPPAP